VLPRKHQLRSHHRFDYTKPRDGGSFGVRPWTGCGVIVASNDPSVGGQDKVGRQRKRCDQFGESESLRHCAQIATEAYSAKRP